MVESKSDSGLSSKPHKPRERAVHLLVPEEAHRRAKLAAVSSGIPFKEFMARLMLAAQPLTPQPELTATTSVCPGGA